MKGPFRLDGRVAIVTGGGRGIGKAIAITFAEAGASVLVATRSREPGREVVEQIVAARGSAVLHCCDLAKPADSTAVVDAAISAFGCLDILVHNAGIFPTIMIEDLNEPALEETLSVNLKSAFRLSAAALPHLKKSEAPRILFTSSVTGPRVVMPGLSHYAASKAGLNGFIRAAALEFAKHRITVNGVEPGLIGTDAMEIYDDIRAMTRTIPLKRLGDPRDIAYAMLYLASEQAGFVTGQTIIVDGGAMLPENAANAE